MFNNDNSTDPWELDPDRVVTVGSTDFHEIVETPLSDFLTEDWKLPCEFPEEYIQIPMDEYMYLIDDSKLLYALRKVGAVTTKIEGEAREFLQEEGDMNV